jgi:hypothetical protein
MAERPVPPPELLEESERGLGKFVPAPELGAWVRSVFMDQSSALYSETHDDVQDARIGWLWTSEPQSRSGKTILGETMLSKVPQALTGWKAARWRHQSASWFSSWWEGEPPHFEITIYARWFAAASDLDALALVKHELLHCRQAVTGEEEPRFNSQTGEPIFGIRGHDVEEFGEVVDWFGPGAIDGSVACLLEVAKRPPRAGSASITGACGTCMRRAA